MPGKDTFATISAGHESSLALDTAGQAWAWGDDRLGQLGNNSKVRSAVPVAVQMRADVAFTMISAGLLDRSPTVRAASRLSVYPLIREAHRAVSDRRSLRLPFPGSPERAMSRSRL
jgi:hypothetical protein